MRHYKNYEVWHLAHELALQTYRVSEMFPAHELYGLTSQVRRAAVSIVSNIAEGAGRNSDADFARFLGIANGSANESESQILVARDLSYIRGPAAETLLASVNGLRRRLIRLIQSMQ